LSKDKNRNNSTISSSDIKDKPIRKKEKWSDIISRLNIDISKPVNHVTAKQIKQTSNEEPRLMAKMDRLEDVPKIFKDNNLFLLPISRKEYLFLTTIAIYVPKIKVQAMW
jgi:hypothetical protein